MERMNGRQRCGRTEMINAIVTSTVFLATLGSASLSCPDSSSRGIPFVMVQGKTILEAPSSHRPQWITFRADGSYVMIEHGVNLTGRYEVHKDQVCFIFGEGGHECRIFEETAAGDIYEHTPSSCAVRKFALVD